MNPICCVCGDELVDWVGNVMVHSERYYCEAAVDHLQVWCKSCTFLFDRDRVFLDLCELRWARNNFIKLLSSAIGDLAHPVIKSWSKEAILELWELGRLAMPEVFNFRLNWRLD